MGSWPFVTCHTCLKPVKGAAPVHDREGAPHHGKCFEIRGLRQRSARTPLRASEPSVRAETCAPSGVYAVRSEPLSSLSDSPAGSSPAGAFSAGGERPRGGASVRSASSGSAGGRV